ncbi:hypothetical protein N8I77_001877 [Diaporthe amygdali]|uniref:Uncharacterized protein n=1 Tax=Phomopsis amygdali TaxID=1214568 RepID=A0AAD9SRS1_PHOAM|nr:hypothetical protein N8I77_001877 [Diaporthe amygdali]
MPEIHQHQEPPGSSVQGFEMGCIESQVMFHLNLAHSAAEAARDQDSPSIFSQCLSHAKDARSLARKAQRHDLQEKTQLATVDFLEMVGRRREAMEARIVAAAMAEKMELELAPQSDTKEGGARLVSVGGVPIDEVIQLLGDDQHDSHPPSFSQRQASAAAGVVRPDQANAAAAYEIQKQGLLPKIAFKGHQIRDLQGRLATVVTGAPKLRRKPRFEN